VQGQRSASAAMLVQRLHQRRRDIPFQHYGKCCCASVCSAARPRATVPWWGCTPIGRSCLVVVSRIVLILVLLRTLILVLVLILILSGIRIPLARRIEMHRLQNATLGPEARRHVV